MKRRSDVGLILGCVAVVIAYAPPAHAYVDAGIGSVLLQVVVASVAGGLLTLRVYWGRIKAVLTRQPTHEESPGPASTTDGDD